MHLNSFPALLSYRHRGHFPQFTIIFPLLLPTITLNFHAFTFSPLSRRLALHSATRLPSNTIVDAINTNLSACSNSEDRPLVVSLETTSMTTANCSGLLLVVHRHQGTHSPIIYNTAFFDNVVNQISHPPCTKTTEFLHHLTHYTSRTSCLYNLYSFNSFCNLFFRNETTGTHKLRTTHFTIPLIFNI